MAFSFTVRRNEPELLAPAEQTPHELKKLSDLDDREDLRSHFPIIMYYPNNPLVDGKDPVKVIREAVAKALVYYYPFAGRLIEGPNKRLMVDCTAQGLLFIEADADISIDMLGDSIQPPCSFAGELLYDVPGSQGVLGCPLVLIQVTRFACGGFSFAVRLNHIMGDGIGLTQFLCCIAAMAQGATKPTIPPVWGRELVTARKPPQVTCVHHEYEEEPNNKMPQVSMDDENLIRRSFFFGSKEIKALRTHLPPHLKRTSTFDIVTACVWKARTIALQVDPNEIVRLTCVVNVRGKEHLNLPNGYYGNALAFPAAIAKARTLSQNPLGYALEQMKKAKSRVTQEYVRSVMDLLAIRGQPALSNSWNFIVSDTSRVGFTEVDFGWGKPMYAGPTVGAISLSTSVYARFRNSKGEDGMVVPVCLPIEAMVRLKEELQEMIQPQKIEQVVPVQIPSML